MTFFSRIHHVVIAVRDLDTAASDWERYLGASVVQPREMADPRRVRRAQIDVGDGWIELAQPVDERSPLWAAVQEREGPYSVAVSVPDAAAVAERARENGARIVGDPASGGPLYVAPESTHGVLLELRDDAERAAGPPLWQRLQHVAVAVLDWDAAKTDWERFFGIPGEVVAANANSPLLSVHFHAGPPRPSYPDSGHDDEPWFGLAHPRNEQVAMHRFLRERGERVYDLSVNTGDREATAAAIRDRGGQILGGTDIAGQVFVHPKHTHGLLLELLS